MDFGRKKTPLFKQNSLILRPNKISLFFKAKRYFFLFVKVRIYVTASNSCTSYFSLLLIMVKARIHLCIIIQACGTNNCWYIHAKFYPFSKFRGLLLANDPFFLISRIRLSLKKYPFFRENGHERGIRFGPTGPKWAPCWHNEPCYLGHYPKQLNNVDRGIQCPWCHYSALPIYHGLFSPNNSRKTHIARSLGRSMGVFREILIWLTFSPLNLVYCVWYRVIWHRNISRVYSSYRNG